MDAIRTMQAKDVVAAKMAKCYITVDGSRYLLMQAKNLEASIEKEKSEVAILGKFMKGHKTTGANGTGSMTIYKNTSLFDKMLMKLINEGVETYFDIQVENEDPSSDAGRAVTILKNCSIDSGVVASYDADGEWLEQDVDFTFEEIEQPTQFNQLDGM